LPLCPQHWEINHQKIERGDGDHARDHNGGKPVQLEQLPDRHNRAGFMLACLLRPRPDHQRDDDARAGSNQADAKQLLCGSERR
jgi:hypothetical protein